MQVSSLQLNLKGDSGAYVLLWVCEICKKMFFIENLLTTASAKYNLLEATERFRLQKVSYYNGFW